MKKLLPYLLLPIMGCSSPSKSSSYDESGCLTIEIKKEEEKLPCDKLIADIDIVPLGAVYKNYIGGIDKIIVTEDRFIIFDRFSSKMVYLFDRQGKFVNYAGRIGRGPGEYLHINDISVIPETGHIAVLDQMSSKVNIYDKKGIFVETKKTKFGITSCQYLDKDNAVGFRIARFAYGKDENPELDNKSIFIFDNDLQKVKWYAFEDQFNSSFKLVTDKLYQMGSQLYYSPNLSSSIYLIQQDSIKKKYQINLENGFSYKDLLAMEKYDNNMYDNKRVFFEECIDTENFLFLNISDNRENKTIVYDKQNNKNYAITLTDKFPPLNNIFNIVFYISENQVVARMRSEQILALRNYYQTWFDQQDKEKMNKKWVEIMSRLLTEVTEESNPVLFVITLKDKIQ